MPFHEILHSSVSVKISVIKALLILFKEGTYILVVSLGLRPADFGFSL